MEQVSERVLKQREYSKAYRERNCEKERERQRVVKEVKRAKDREAYNAYQREWNAKNKDRINAIRREKLKNDTEYAEKVRARGRRKYAKDPENHKSIRLKSIYGLSIDLYMEMYNKQNGKCAICGIEKPSKGAGGLSVDHCHKTGKVRKLLCTSCNTAIGKLKDSVDVLRKAVDYLLEFSD